MEIPVIYYAIRGFGSLHNAMLGRELDDDGLCKGIRDQAIFEWS
jgi:hypothetical protein